MNAIPDRPDLFPADMRPVDILDRLIARFGLWRVVAALAGRLVRRQVGQRPRRGPSVADLPDRLRRDIGLADMPGLSPHLSLHGAGFDSPVGRR